jgi:aminopeptidase N
MKGAEIIRMLKVLIGNDAFARAWISISSSRWNGGDVEDFISCFAETSGGI